MKIYRVWHNDENLGLYVAANEREAVGEAFNDTQGTDTPVGFRAERWDEQPTLQEIPPR